MPFISVANLVSAILTELKQTYVTAENQLDKKMRKTIEKTIQIVNSYGELSNLIIKGNPFLDTKMSIGGDASLNSNSH